MDKNNKLVLLGHAKYNEFLRWVESTSLFHAIKNDPSGTIIESDSISFKLDKSIAINKAEDLPKEVLYEFFLNSPFYFTLKDKDNE